MGVDKPKYRCRWVRDRLPLLAGGELMGADRRQVERHLIACAGCRRHERSLVGALGALHTAALESPVKAEAPSLWPALARQIRESRHGSRTPTLPTFSRPGAWLGALVASPVRFRPAWTLALVLGSLGLTATGVHLWTRWQIAASQAEIEFAGLPNFDDEEDLGFVPPPVVVVVPVPEPSPAPKLAVAGVTVDRTAARVDYDLDHGTPMGPDAVDVKASY